MAELKHTFTSGRMNKDLDDRLVPNGEYIDALNIQVSSSEGSDVGAIENILGNEQLSDLQLNNAKTLGSISDSKNNKIYWIVTSDSIDAIYEYNEKTKVIKAILIDEKSTQNITIKDLSFYLSASGNLLLPVDADLNTVFGNINTGDNEETCIKHNVELSVAEPEIKISIPKNTIIKVVKEGNEKRLEFQGIFYNDKEYGNLDVTFTYTRDGFLNLSKNHLITGINIIDGLLFWTDNLNQPRRINISEFSSYKIIANQTQIKYTEKKFDGSIETKYRPITEDDISVVKKSPKTAPKLDVYDTLITDTSKLSLNVTFDFGQKPDASGTTIPQDYAAGDTFTLQNISDIPEWEIGASVRFTTTEEDIIVEAVVNSVNASSIDLTISNLEFDDSGLAGSYNYLVELIEDDPIYELAFVRFAYRWKYKNGEYSVFSPFTVPAFYPFLKYFRYDGKEAFNYGMINQTRKITLTDFDLGSDEVEEIDIIFKETKNNNVYTLLTKKRLDFEPTKDKPNADVFTITKEQIHSVIDNKQLLRQWDNVPLKAKAQEVTANRIIYGNYTQGYTVNDDVAFSVKTKTLPSDKQYTVKSNRTYQMGVVYSDEYNRQTPVFSNDSGAISIPKKLAATENRIAVSLTSNPPGWATHFRYFIKETSGEYYNLAADRFYKDDENGFTYISFPSGERNKVTEEHYLILKKNHGDNEYVSSKTNRYKIIDISAEPPEFITSRLKGVISFADVEFTDDYSGSGGGTKITNKSAAENNAPIKDFASIQIKKANGSSDGVPLTDTKEIKPGRYITFEYLGRESNPYKIKRLSQHPEGDNEIKIDFEDPFGEDVEIIYQKASGNVGDSSTNFGVNMNVFEEFSAAGDKEFDGRFFIKLKTNATLSDAVISQTVGGKEYMAKASANLIGVYSRNDENGTGRGGADKYNNTNRAKNSAGSDPRNKFVVSFGGSNVNGSTPEQGKQKTVGSLSYNITLEAATHRVNHEVDKLAKLAKVGNFVRFVNSDGTPHHDKIYEIGNVLVSDFKSRMGGNKFTKNRTFKEISFRFIDEDGNKVELEQKVCTRGFNTWDSEPSMEILQELNNEKIFVKEPAIFETEPLPSKTDLNIYFEASDVFDISEHSNEKILNWYNAICFKNGVESNRIRDDFNATFIDNGVKASTVLREAYKQENKFNGIIFSGIINSRSGVNQTNEFSMANSITKDLLPSYGSIQKFHAWDDSMVILCEDKTLRVLANKSALYNADGSSNLISDARVLGDPVEYNGEFGISLNPESFASYGFRCYFADKARGVVLRLSKDGLTPISGSAMGGFFEERLQNASTILGSYDSNLKVYNISFIDLDTVCFSEDVQGWVSRLSFIPENAVYLNNIYYTYRNGELWQQHSDNVKRNNFYGSQYNSNVEFIINDNPSTIKKFKTLGYEGTSGWTAKTIKTDQVIGNETGFIPKENKYFANITQEKKLINTLDQKNFSTQGIGRSVAAGAAAYTDQVGAQTFDKFNVKLSDGTSFSSKQKNDIIIKTDTSIDDIQIVIKANNGYLIEPSFFNSPSTLITFEKSNNDVIATIKGSYLESLSPTNGQTLNITITARVVLQPVKVSGTATITGFNFTDNIGTSTFEITNDPNTIQVINTRIISANDGYLLKDTGITVNNSAVTLNILELPSGDFQVKETIILPNVTTTNLNYTITVAPEEIIIPDKIIFSSLLNTANVLNDGETRQLSLTGEVGAEAEITLSYDSTNIITDLKFVKNTETIDLVLPAGDTAKTFTIKIENKDGTVFDNNFGAETFTLTRPLRTRNDIMFTIDAGSFVTTANKSTLAPFITSGYSSDTADINFKKVITLNGTGYSLTKIPTFDDVQFSQNNTNTFIEFTTFTLASATNDTLTIEAKITSDNFVEDENFYLDLDKFLNKNVTLTIAYSATIAGGSATSNYSITGYQGASIPYTIVGPANKTHSTQANYYFTLTASGSYKPKKGILTPFKIYDASNNDVTATYAENSRVSFGSYAGASTPQLHLGFKNVAFKMPSTNQTITIRPTEEIFEAQSGVEIRALLLFKTRIEASGFEIPNGGSRALKGAPQVPSTKWAERADKWAGIIPNSTTPATMILRGDGGGASPTAGWMVSLSKPTAFSDFNTGRYWINDGSAGNKLLQHILTIPDNLFYWWDPDVTDTSKYNLTNLGSYFSKASAGSYTDIFGNSKSVASTFEVSDNGKTLTANMLVNFNNNAVGLEVYYPEILTTVNNDYPNYFNEFDVKIGRTVTHINNPCSLVTDDSVDFLKLQSNSKTLTDGSLLYERDNRGNLLSINDLHFQYLKDNVNLFKMDRDYRYPTGHFKFIQQENKVKFTDTKCAIPVVSSSGVLKPQVLYDRMTYAATQGVEASPAGGYYHTFKIPILAKGYENKKIKIEGTYYDGRYAGYPLDRLNTLGNVGSGNLYIVKHQSAQYDPFGGGVTGQKAIEAWDTPGLTIEDPVKNIWSAEVQIDGKAKGNIEFKLQTYNNMSISHLYLSSTQIEDKAGRTLESGVKFDDGYSYVILINVPAKSPQPLFDRFDSASNSFVFNGNYRAGTGYAGGIVNYPRNTNFPDLGIDAVLGETEAQYRSGIDSQWTTGFRTQGTFVPAKTF